MLATPCPTVTTDAARPDAGTLEARQERSIARGNRRCRPAAAAQTTGVNG
jgi:hypothetical protein